MKILFSKTAVEPKQALRVWFTAAIYRPRSARSGLLAAFTLIELIVAILLTSVVVLGIFSINMVLINNQRDYGQRYLVRSATQVTLNHILNNVSLAHGSVNTNDEGILIGAQLQDADANSFCIHQPGTSTTGGQNLVNSASDIWLCYSWVNTYQINWCAETYSGPGADPRGASSCSYANSNGHLISGTSVTFLGSAYSISYLNGASTPPSFTPTIGSFSMTIQNCLNNSASTCKNTGTSTDPANNPEVQISGSVFPPQVSTG